MHNLGDESGLNRFQSAPDARWLELVGSVPTEDLVAAFMAGIREIPTYENPPVPWSEIRYTAVESFEGLKRALTTGNDDELRAAAMRVGASRASANVPLESLLMAVRNDFSVLWQSLIDAASRADSEVLIRNAALVWQCVDDYARAVQREYLAEVQRRSDSQALINRGLLNEILGDKPLLNARIPTVAEALGVDPNAQFCVAVASDGALPSLQAAVARLDRAGLSVHAVYRAENLVVFVEHPRSLAELGDSTGILPVAREANEAVRSLATLEIGLVWDVAGLRGLRDAALLATELASLVVPGSSAAVTPETGWAKLAKRGLEDKHLSVAADVERLLRACGVAERRNLEEAVRAYLKTGSVAESAAATFCHRNTLTNRLHRFGELTGIDVTVPEQAARLVISWA